MFRGTGTHFWHGCVGSGIVNMATIIWYRILMCFKDMNWYFTRSSVFLFLLLSLRCFRRQPHYVNMEEYIVLSDMQHSQTHVTLYWSVIFFSWCVKMLRKVESLIVVLLSASLASLGPPSSGGINMLLWSSLTNTWNNNFIDNCVSVCPSIDNFRLSFSIGDCTTWGWCRIKL